MSVLIYGKINLVTKWSNVFLKKKHRWICCHLLTNKFASRRAKKVSGVKWRSYFVDMRPPTQTTIKIFTWNHNTLDFYQKPPASSSIHDETRFSNVQRKLKVTLSKASFGYILYCRLHYFASFDYIVWVWMSMNVFWKRMTTVWLLNMSLRFHDSVFMTSIMLSLLVQQYNFLILF